MQIRDTLPKQVLKSPKIDPTNMTLDEIRKVNLDGLKMEEINGSQAFPGQHLLRLVEWEDPKTGEC